MKKSNVILFIILFCLFGCKNESNHTTVVKDESFTKRHDSINRKAQNELQDISCKAFSKSVNDFIELLKFDKYNIAPSESEVVLEFNSYKSNAPDELVTKLTIPKTNFKSFEAKRKIKLKGSKDNWYPTFLVYELYYDNEQIAIESFNKIEKIIYHDDFWNNKTYDFIIMNGTKLIYVWCGAKIFEDYAFSYKEKIEKLINQNKR